MIWGSRVSGALRSFDPWISGWHPGSVSSGGESELCHRDGARHRHRHRQRHRDGASLLKLLPPIRGHLPPPYPPSLPWSCAELIKSPSCIIQVCQGRQQHWVYFVIFSIIYDLDHPEKARGSAHVVRRLSVRSATQAPAHAPPTSWQLCGNVSKCPPRVHPDTPNTVQLSAQQKMGGPTLPASAENL